MSTSSLPAAISVDPMSHALDPGELLGVDMEHAAWGRVLVALRWIEGLLESPESAEPDPLELSRDRGDRDPRLESDLPGGLPAPAQLLHAA